MLLKNLIPESMILVAFMNGLLIRKSNLDLGKGIHLKVFLFIKMDSKLTVIKSRIILYEKVLLLFTMEINKCTKCENHRV